MRSRICGTGSALPKREVTNDDLSKIMDTSDEWIKSRTGIGARHLAVEETLSLGGKSGITGSRSPIRRIGYDNSGDAFSG